MRQERLALLIRLHEEQERRDCLINPDSLRSRFLSRPNMSLRMI